MSNSAGTDWNYIADPDIDAHTGFILAEEAALKRYVSGHSVPNPKAPGGSQEVPVWFRWPEGERKIVYPYVTIDMLSVFPDYSRWQSVWDVGGLTLDFENPDTGQVTRSGMYFPSETPDVQNGDTDQAYSGDRYLGYKILFQVAHHSRNARHDRYLQARFMTDLFPPQQWFIGVDADATWRRCELVDFTPQDLMESAESGTKRIFRKVYTISMEAEIAPTAITYLEEARQVHVDIYNKEDVDANDNVKKEAVGHSSTADHDIAIDNYTDPLPSGS